MTRDSFSSADATFITTADTGILEWQAERLVRSLNENSPRSDIVVFVPQSSIEDLSEEAMDLFTSNATVVSGVIPIPEYPISALIQAFIEGERVAETKFLVALDTDTLVLNEPQLPGAGDTWLRPADVGVQYWTTERAQTDWKSLYEAFDLTPPTRDEWLISSVDHNPIPPYWNSGVVATTDRTLPSRWLAITRELFERDDLPVDREEFFIDQISLSLAVRKNSVYELSEHANFPLGGRVTVPRDVQVLHYGDARNLARIPSPEVRRQLHRLDALPKASISDFVRTGLDLASTQSGRVLTYDQKRRVRQLVSSVL